MRTSRTNAEAVGTGGSTAALFGMKPKPLGDDLLRPTLRVAMPRAACLYAPEGTVHVVARCNNREFCFTTPEDFELLLAHLREMIRTSDVTLYAYTLMSNHIHLLLQAPKPDDFPDSRSTSASSGCRSIPG